MVILIQHVASGSFWSGTEWVPNIAAARQFTSSAEAIDFSVVRRINGIRFVLYFEDSRDDVYLKPFRDRDVPTLDTTPVDPDAKLAELAAIRASMREQELTMQADIDDITRRLDALNQRLRLEEKNERLRADPDLVQP